jgi:hypothetical protein
MNSPQRKSGLRKSCLRKSGLRCSVLLSALYFGGGCAQAIMGDTDQVTPPDASIHSDAAVVYDARGPADASVDAAPVSVTSTLQAGSENTVLAQNSISCSQAGQHRDNRYMRTYPLDAAGITTDFEVTSVAVGIETAASTGASQPIDVRLHTLSGPLQLANLTQIASESVAVPPQTGSILNVPITALVPAGSTLVVEVHTPDGVAPGNTFFIGSNRASEDTPSFLIGDDCANPEPTAAGALGVPGLIMSIVLNVTGDHTSPQ